MPQEQLQPETTREQPVSSTASSARFRRVGGSYQLALDSGAALEGILTLDEAHWAVTSINIDTLRADRQFLEFLDDDHNGQIRTDEVKRAVGWLLELLLDRSGIDRATDELRLDAINRETPEGSAIYDAASLILNNLHRSDAASVTLDEARNEKQIIACADRNGDGIIPPEVLATPGAAALACDVIAFSGARTDLSGKPGLDGDMLESFLKAAAEHLKWRKDGERPELRIFGDETEAVYTAYHAVQSALDDYFLACATLEFGSNSAPVRPDPLDREAVRHFLESAPAANPRPDRVLDFTGPVNPLWIDRLRAFASLPVLRESFGADQTLSEAEWRRLQSRMAPYEQWIHEKPTGDMSAFTSEQLELDLNAAYATEIRDAIAADLAVAPRLQYSDALCKLLLYQKYMLEFVNNFVCLAALFNPSTPSMLQAGQLVMDGRRFTLITPVKNIAEHKSIAQLSDICVMYVEAVNGASNALKKQILAAAVTSGDMRNLFVGKRGIFFSADGTPWDARVIDFIQQPVSISEALRMPFYRFGEFIGKQADKFLSTRSSDAQKALEKNISSALTAPPDAAAVPAAPAAPAAAPKTATSGSMLLMGGGIGLAAIGSSIAFIAKSLQNISFWNIIAVLLGIILIFGGPIVTISLVKLYRRNMARFLEANACAVNRPLRLSRKMGVIFTYTPTIPHLALLKGDLIDTFRLVRPVRRTRLWLLLLLLFILLLAAGISFWLRRSAPAQPPTETVIEKNIGNPAE